MFGLAVVVTNLVPEVQKAGVAFASHVAQLEVAQSHVVIILLLVLGLRVGHRLGRQQLLLLLFPS